MAAPLFSGLFSGLDASGVRRAGGGVVPMPDPTTVNFTSAQFAADITGSISTTKNAARVYGRAAMTLWAGVIKGTGASIVATSEWGAQPGLIEFAIDGGAFAAAPNAGTLYTLFSDLPQASRFVEIRFAEGFGDAPYFASTGDVLSVIGQPPSITPVTGWAELGADSATSFSNGTLVANVSTYSPKLSVGKGNTYGSTVATIKLKGAFNNLYVLMTGNLRKVGVSKNGQAPTFHSADPEVNLPVRVLRIPCDGSNSTYYVWDDGCGRPGGGHLSVAGDTARQNVGVQRRIDQYGDSITFGTGPGATPVDVETMQVAAALGFVGGTNGVGGHKIADCKALLDVVIPAKTITSNDVAVLAIGRNNVPDIDATEQADYGLCIDKLVAAGYGKVLCRGILPTPDGAVLWGAENTVLQAVVAAKANPNVIWVHTETWLGWATTDNDHPTAAGYVTLAGFATAAYSSALGL